MSTSSFQSGLPSRLAHRSQTALTTAAVARWMTPFSGPEPAQLRVGGEAAPEAAHVARRSPRGRGPTTSGSSARTAATTDLGAAADREGQAVALEAVVRVGAQHDVGRRVVGIGVHRVRAVEPARGREADVARLEPDDRRRVAHRAFSPVVRPISPIFTASTSPVPPNLAIQRADRSTKTRSLQELVDELCSASRPEQHAQPSRARPRALRGGAGGQTPNGPIDRR